MNRPISVYSPVVIPLLYDSLHASSGCRSINGIRRGKPLRLSELCIFDPIEVDEPAGFGAKSGVTYFRGPKTAGDKVMKSQWAVWVSGTQLRYGRVGIITPPAATTGSLAPFSLGGDKPSRIAASITALGKLAIAIESGDTIKISHEGISTIDPFPGESPVLFFTGLLLGSVDEGEIACYYLKPGSPGMYIRLESDDYAVERVVLPSIPIEMGHLVMARTRNNRLEILAKDAYDRSVVFKSVEYFVEHNESRSSSVSFLRGTVVTGPDDELVDEEGELGVEFTSGVTTEPLVSFTPIAEESGASVEFLSGLAYLA